MLEFCCLTREFNEDDAKIQPRFEVSQQSSLMRGRLSPQR
jgi:hypothetical protein